MTAFKAAAVALTLALMLAAPFPAAAAGDSDKPDRGPEVGAPIPHSLRALDQQGRYRDFKALARRRGLIILFARSLDW